MNENVQGVLEFVRTNTYSSFYKNLPNEWDEVPTIDTAAVAQAETLFHYPESEIRYTVSNFDGMKVDDLFLIPQRTDYVWEMLDENLKTVKPKVAVLIVPLFWQIGPMFYQTCRANGVPVSVMTPRNLPLAIQLIQEVKADMVVGTPEALAELQTLLIEAGLQDQIRSWHVVAEFGAVPSLSQLSGDVSLEYHLFPGMPVARCIDDVYTKPNHIAPLSEYMFEVSSDNTCLITSLAPHALPLIRFDTRVNIAKENDTFLLPS